MVQMAQECVYKVSYYEIMYSVSKKIIFYFKFSGCRIQDSKIIPATYISQNLEANNVSWKWSTTAEHLNIYIPDDRNLEKSIEYFVKLYSMRTRSDREHWLLDVSPLVQGLYKNFKNIFLLSFSTTIICIHIFLLLVIRIPDEESSLNNAIENLKDLPLDLDDDLFFYSHDQRWTSILENNDAY